MAEQPTTSSYGDSRVVTLLVTMTIRPEKEQEFIDFAGATVRRVHESEPGTLLYVLNRHPSKPHTYVWVERYRDVDALEAHSEAPYMADVMSKLPNWLSQPPELTQLSQIEPA